MIRRSGEVRPGSQPGNVRLRLARPPESVRVSVQQPRPVRRSFSPPLLLVTGFGGLIAVGTLLLTLPPASRSGEWTDLVTALFTATSAVCVTGLVVVDTWTYWSPFGQAVILLLIQAGGLGVMTVSTLLFLVLRRRLTLRNRQALTETLGAQGPGAVAGLVRRIVLFTLTVEAAGFVVLSLAFLPGMAPLDAAWQGLFTSVSAFNNAGFDLAGGFVSLAPWAASPLVLGTVAAVIILGGISWTVVEDVLRKRQFAALTVDTRIVLLTTAALLLLGTAGFLLVEGGNAATIGTMPFPQQVLNAAFQSVSTRTAGFASFDNAGLSEAGSLVTMSLMFIGGASGSAAGGIKVQTFAILFLAIVSAARGYPEVEVFRRRVPFPYVLRAVGVALLFLAGVFLTAFLLNLTDDPGFQAGLFEAFSAMGTVGLTQGLTPSLSDPGRLVLVAAMFAGRLGPLTLVLALAIRESSRDFRWPADILKVA